MDDMLIDPEIIGEIHASTESYVGSPIVTLCGSTRFKDEFLQAAKELTLQGVIVLSVGCFPHYDDLAEPEVALGQAVKELVDDLHKEKISMSHAIFVLNVNGYIGSSTQSEIDHAESLDIDVYLLEGEDG